MGGKARVNPPPLHGPWRSTVHGEILNSDLYFRGGSKHAGLPGGHEARMKILLGCLLAGLALLGGCLTAGYYLHRQAYDRNPVAPRTFVSPNRELRTVLSNAYGLVDTNVTVEVGPAPEGRLKTVYRSGNSNRLTPAFPGRIAWSRDSGKFVLLGRWSTKTPGLRTRAGETPLMVYDAKTGAVRSNGNEDNYPLLTPLDLKDADFGEVLEPASSP